MLTNDSIDSCVVPYPKQIFKPTPCNSTFNHISIGNLCLMSDEQQFLLMDEVTMFLYQVTMLLHIQCQLVMLKRLKPPCVDNIASRARCLPKGDRSRIFQNERIPQLSLQNYSTVRKQRRRMTRQTCATDHAREADADIC